MKSLFLLVFTLFTTIPSIESVRNSYKEVSSSKENAEAFYKKLEDVKESNNTVLIAYKAASIALKAKYVKGIKNKKALFKEGAILLENQIKKKPNDIELRLIRLSIQENIPKLLKYKANILEDKTFIYENISKIKNRKKLDYFKSFVSQSKSFNKQEKNVISEI